MNINRSDIERQLGYFEAMRSVMQAEAAYHRQEGNEESAHHCAGVAEGLSIGAVSLRCILEKPEGLKLAEGWPEMVGPSLLPAGRT